jgi:hypothetical protein
MDIAIMKTNADATPLMFIVFLCFIV